MVETLSHTDAGTADLLYAINYNLSKCVDGPICMGHRLLVGMAILLWMESRGSWVHSFEHSHFVFVPLPLQAVL